MTNYLTYTLVEMMTWQGLGDIINRFREKALGLPTLSFIGGPGLLNRLKVPYTYCWYVELLTSYSTFKTYVLPGRQPSFRNLTTGETILTFLVSTFSILQQISHPTLI